MSCQKSWWNVAIFLRRRRDATFSGKKRNFYLQTFPTKSVGNSSCKIPSSIVIRRFCRPFPFSAGSLVTNSPLWLAPVRICTPVTFKSFCWSDLASPRSILCPNLPHMTYVCTYISPFWINYRITEIETYWSHTNGKWFLLNLIPGFIYIKGTATVGVLA